jgi:HrpA-like RNA helicase
VYNGHLGAKSKRSYRYSEHSDGGDIDRVLTPSNGIRRNSIVKTENERLSSIELIQMIDQLLSKAEEQQQEFDINDNESNNSDDEQVFEVIQENPFKELRLQKNEFQSAIDRLATEFNSTLSSARSDRYDVLQLKRIHKQLERELKRWQSCLPIYASRSDILGKLEKNQVLILKADTGSGKSTQTVQYLCDEHFADHSEYNIIFF